MEKEKNQETTKLYQEDKTLKKELQLTSAKKGQGILGKFKLGLKKTKEILVDDLKEALLGDEELDEILFDEIEENLLSADIGVPTTRRILAKLEELYAKGKIKNKKQTFAEIRKIITQILNNYQKPLPFKKKETNLILFIGVNGVGKTTTIGKMASLFAEENKKVLIAAGDTFRAAAIDQLKIWAKRSGADFFAKEMGSDAAATIYQATEKALKEKYDFLLCDTSGRLHTNKNLMEELIKIKKIVQKLCPENQQTLLILDASTGQNAVQQVKIFQKVIAIDGLIITKLDGTSKGGVIIGLINEFELPLYYIGVGEKIEHLQSFNSELFAEALFS